jgi:hypothetical protein
MGIMRSWPCHHSPSVKLLMWWEILLYPALTPWFLALNYTQSNELIQSLTETSRSMSQNKLFLFISCQIFCCSNRNLTRLLFAENSSRSGTLHAIKTYTSQVPVAHACNPSYSGAGDQEDHGLKPAGANSSQDPIMKKIHHTKKGCWSGSSCRPWIQTLVPQKTKQNKTPQKHFPGGLYGFSKVNDWPGMLST